jgi:sugar phosphate isomerase/epimerase
MKLGVRLESLGVPARKGLVEARRLGVSGVQVDAAGDLAPDRLSTTGRREFRHLLRGHGLDLAALGCPLRHGFDTPENLQPRIDHVRKVMTLAVELGARAVVVEAGRIPDKPDDPRAALLTESLLALGQHGDRIGALLALETGAESGAILRQFLDRLDTGGLGANYDPANLLMNGLDPLAELPALSGRIAHVHAKDARRGGASRSAQEVPLGHGDIDWLQVVGTMSAQDYRGWLTVERESGTNRAADVAGGLAFLRRFVG